jgi:hypothetical protein
MGKNWKHREETLRAVEDVIISMAVLFIIIMLYLVFEPLIVDSSANLAKEYLNENN